MVLEIEHNQTELADQAISQLVEATLAAEDGQVDRIQVSFVDAEAIAELNQQHRGKSGPTDVLSYPFDNSFPQGSGGQIVIAPEVAADNAAKLGRPVKHELALLVVHGVLHLLGYTDDTETGAAEMDQRTAPILEHVKLRDQA